MSLHLLYTYSGRPPLEDSLRGNCTALPCTGLWFLTGWRFDDIIFQKCMSSFYGIFFPGSRKVSEPVPVLFIMVCLNGVHVEAKGHWSITTSVTLALAFYHLSQGGGGGALSTAERWSEEMEGTCSLPVLCDFILLSFVLHNCLHLLAMFLCISCSGWSTSSLLEMKHIEWGILHLPSFNFSYYNKTKSFHLKLFLFLCG